MKLEGGCFCGAIRYAIDGDPIDAGYCHCSQCRKSSGAPVVAWGTFPRESFAWTQGTPAVYAAPGRGHRAFCPTCGTQLTFLYTADATTIDVTLGSLDDCSLIQPHYHIWWQNKVPWLHMGDDLPRHADAGPDGFPPPESTSSD